MAVPEEPQTRSLEPSLRDVVNPSDRSGAMKVEKRAAPQRQYNFGIGKKFDPELADDQSSDSEDTYDLSEDKRATQRFQFGLGKRTRTDQRFGFGLGKRNPYENRFQFGLGKRATQRDNRFAFGLGKRQSDFDEYIKRRYSFGLGKRTASEQLIDSRSSSDESSDR